MRKTLKQILQEYGNLQDNYDYTLNTTQAIDAVKEWLTQKQQQYKYGTSGHTIIKELLEELNQ